ncbi:MAG: hypothetical protein DRP68_05925 [Candidatus Omnitrophota bacterium]|nr:MAG: hypothetical protein DRP68_05925 [Candidatus Omnitrophota bacterium]
MKQYSKLIGIIFFIGGLILCTQGVSLGQNIDENLQEVGSVLQILYDLLQDRISGEQAIESLEQVYGDTFTPQQVTSIQEILNTLSTGNVDFGAVSQEILGVVLPDITVPAMAWIYNPDNTPLGVFSLYNGTLTGFNFINGNVSLFQSFVSDYKDFVSAMQDSPFWAPVFASMNEGDRADTLKQLYEALTSGELAVGEEININGVRFVLVPEGQGARLDAFINGEQFKMRHLDPTLTANLTADGKKNWKKKMKGDPAATGKVYKDKDGNWKMKVKVWTNFDKTNWEEIEVTLDLDSFLDPQEREAIEKELEKAGRTGEEITLYGVSEGDILFAGATLQLLGLGKGDFELHPYDYAVSPENEKDMEVTKNNLLDERYYGYFYPLLQRNILFQTR